MRIATFHHAEFSDCEALLAAKERSGACISLCIPTFNEESTIGEVVSVLRAALRDRVPLLDEILVMDSGSEDRTREVARAAGAEVRLASEVLPGLPEARGKGENIWKGVAASRGDIVAFVDGDVTNMSPRFVTGTVGPLLREPGLEYVKGFYDRPHGVAEIGTRPAGGGRVTEALVRPLFSLFVPELSGVVQPLSGEFAARRSVLEALEMPTGYGVEVAHLMDVLRLRGAGAIGQTDLEERRHRHQDTAALGRMSFAILHAFLRRARSDGFVLSAPHELARTYRHFVRREGVMREEEWLFTDLERPPLISLEAYLRSREGSRATSGR